MVEFLREVEKSLGDELFRVTINGMVHGTMVMLAILVSVLWKRYRRPHWPDNPGMIAFPGGRWAVIGVGLAVVLLAWLAAIVVYEISNYLSAQPKVGPV